MSGSTISIGDVTVLPDISISNDKVSANDIININDFDLGLLGNKQKIVTTPPRQSSPGIVELNTSIGDSIDFVNLEDSNVTLNIRPVAPQSNGGDTIRIVRDVPASPLPPMTPKPLTDVPFTLKTGQSSAFNPIATPIARPAAPVPTAPPTPPEVKPIVPEKVEAPPAKSWYSTFTNFSTTNANENKPTPPATQAASSWFGGGTATNVEQPILTSSTVTAPTSLTPEQEAIKKKEGLTMLERMDRKGVSGTKMSMANSYDEILAELSKRKDSKGLEASIRFQRSMLTTVSSGMEFLNNRYDPLGINLDGWSEQINENLEDYDEMFEELYDKYKDRSKVAPEVRLIMSLGLSAAMCHVTNTMFKSRMPGMDDILRKNPGLAKQMAMAAAQEVGPGFANFVSMGMGNNQNGQNNQNNRPPPSNPLAEMFGGGNPLAGLMSSMGSMGGPPMGGPSMGQTGGPSMGGPPMGQMGGHQMGGHQMGGNYAGESEQYNSPPPAATARREMRGPTGVDDIIEKLHNGGEHVSQRIVPNIDTEDVGSVASGMTTDTMRRAGISRRGRKPTAAQPVGSTLTLNV